MIVKSAKEKILFGKALRSTCCHQDKEYRLLRAKEAYVGYCWINGTVVRQEVMEMFNGEI